MCVWEREREREREKVRNCKDLHQVWILYIQWALLLRLASHKNIQSFSYLRASFTGNWYWTASQPGDVCNSPRASVQNGVTSCVTGHGLLSLCWLLGVENVRCYIFFGRQRTLPTQFTRHFRCLFFIWRRRCISCFEIHDFARLARGQYIKLDVVSMKGAKQAKCSIQLNCLSKCVMAANQHIWLLTKTYQVLILSRLDFVKRSL